VGGGDVPVVEGEPSVDDVACFGAGDLFGGQGVEGDQSDGKGYGGSGELSASRMAVVSRRTGMVALTGVSAGWLWIRKR
jgi:hypothetical protein